MVTQYPHIIAIESKSSDAVQDDDGNWIPGTDAEVVYLPCRAESATGNGYLNGVDGQRIDYSWIVYLPFKGSTSTTVTFENGQHVKLSTGDVEIIVGDDEAGTNSISRSSLNGKTFTLERRGVGELLSSEFSTLPGGGFTLADSVDAIKAGEIFIAHTYDTITTATALSAILSGNASVNIKPGNKATVTGTDGNGGTEVILTDTVKRFSRGQLNSRLWL
jgi:hypothetical protein